jgi:hypothetical protein
MRPTKGTRQLNPACELDDLRWLERALSANARSKRVINDQPDPLFHALFLRGHTAFVAFRP